MSTNAEIRQGNIEKRKEIFDNFDARFENIEKYINEDINTRLDHIGKYAHEHPG